MIPYETPPLRQTSTASEFRYFMNLNYVFFCFFLLAAGPTILGTDAGDRSPINGSACAKASPSRERPFPTLDELVLRGIYRGGGFRQSLDLQGGVTHP